MSPVGTAAESQKRMIANRIPWHMHCKFCSLPAPPEVTRVRFLTTRSLLIPALAVFALAAWPQDAAAQRRGRVVVRGGVYRPVYVRPVYVRPWYRVGYPWFGHPWYGYQFGYPYPPYGYYDPTSSIRLEVTPTNTEVYVDGYLAGTVDDFDGFFQRLRLLPGEHELVLYLDGHRTVTQQLYLGPRADQKIRHTMVPLQPGESQEPRPEPSEQEVSAPEPPAGIPRPIPGPSGPGRGGPPLTPPPGPPVESSARYGAVAVRVQPDDAEVYIDGEPWTAPPGQQLVVQLPVGRHRVEIRRTGYQTYSADVDVSPGETVPLNVSLLRQ
jgi:hypothetical protein